MTTIDDPPSLGAMVRARRRALGVTQKDLALTSGTGLRFIGELEKGKATCHVGKAFHVLQALGVRLTVALPPVGEHGSGAPTP